MLPSTSHAGVLKINRSSDKNRCTSIWAPAPYDRFCRAIKTRLMTVPHIRWLAARLSIAKGARRPVFASKNQERQLAAVCVGAIRHHSLGGSWNINKSNYDTSRCVNFRVVDGLPSCDCGFVELCGPYPYQRCSSSNVDEATTQSICTELRQFILQFFPSMASEIDHAISSVTPPPRQKTFPIRT